MPGQATLIGKVLDRRYRVVAPLGRGGMGTLYTAEHVSLGQRVAIKFLRDDLAVKPGAVRRFLQEARVLSALQHEHLVRVLDLGETAGAAYYVMELLDGEDLRARLRSAPTMAWSSVRTVALQICGALSEAHRRGVVHRDLKPENCFLVRRLDASLFVKLIDFGIAKVARDVAGAPQLTGTGEALGTVGYMAPEQMEGVADARVDIYALGALMFEMLAGRPMFCGNAYEVIARVLRESPPSLHDVCPDAAPELEQLLRRATSRSPAERFASVMEFAEAIAEVPTDANPRDPPGPPHPLASPVQSEPGLDPAAPTLPAWSTRREAISAQPHPPTEERYISDNLLRWLGAATLTPDGHVVTIDRSRHLVVILPDQSRRIVHKLGQIKELRGCVQGHIFVATSARGDVLLDTTSLALRDFRSPECDGPVWMTPQGERYATLADGNLLIREIDGTRVALVAHLDDADEKLTTVAFSPDGQFLAFARLSERRSVTHVWVANGISGEISSDPFAVSPPRPTRWEQGFAWIGSRCLAMIDTVDQDSVLLIADVDASGRVERTTRHRRWPGQLIEVLGGRPGELLYGQHRKCRAIHVAVIDSQGRLGPPAELDSAGWAGNLAGWTRDGQLVYSERSAGRRQLLARHPDGAPAVLYVLDDGGLSAVAIDEASDHVLYLRETGDRNELWSCDLAGGAHHRIAELARDADVVGDSVDCFVLERRDGAVVLVTIDLNTGALAEPLATLPMQDIPAVAITPREILFGGHSGDEFTILTRATGEVERRRVPGAWGISSVGVGPRDGEYLVTTTFYEPVSCAAVLHLRCDGAIDVAVANGVWYYRPHLSRDGSRVAFEGVATECTAWLMPLAAGAPTS